MSVSFFRGSELVVGALLLVVVVVGVLVWLWFSGLGKAASSAELAPDVLKIEGATSLTWAGV
jgi:nitrate/TMAO reductase-like tetraheme cytochrome c subunit